MLLGLPGMEEKENAANLALNFKGVKNIVKDFPESRSPKRN